MRAPPPPRVRTTSAWDAGLGLEDCLTDTQRRARLLEGWVEFFCGPEVVGTVGGGGYWVGGAPDGEEREEREMEEEEEEEAGRWRWRRWERVRWAGGGDGDGDDVGAVMIVALEGDRLEESEIGSADTLVDGDFEDEYDFDAEDFDTSHYVWSGE